MLPTSLPLLLLLLLHCIPIIPQAVLNVTSDASRVADLLEEFMGQYSSDPQLKSKFLAFMADQADTKYSVVDNKLNWVLWMYSLIWMPLLVLMCLTRMGKGSGSHEPRHAVPTGQPHMQGQQAAAGPGPYSSTDQLTKLRVSSLSGDAAYSSSTAGGPDLAPRRRMLAAGGSLDLPPRYSVPGSFGRPYGDDIDGSTRSAATGRSLRSAINSGSVGRQRASSDRLHMSRPSKLNSSASLPPHAANLKNSSTSSSRSGSGGLGGSLESQKLSGYGQGLNARLSAGFDRQGSNSSGVDTKGAGADQQGIGRGSSHSWVQQQQQGAGVFLDSDAAAAADGVTVR